LSDRSPVFAAIDFGASSGRVLTGRLDDGRVELAEVARFANRPVRLPDGLHWNLLALFSDAVRALQGAGRLKGIGVDTWGVDYALLDEHGSVLGLPFHYRDGRSTPFVERAFELLSREGLYAATGIQTLPFNTIFQLLSEVGTSRLRAAHKLALIPDLLTLWLSGEHANEVTNASTTGLLDARSGGWARGVIELMGLPKELFGELVEPGTPLGAALGAHELTGAPTVYTVASHDTASAFVAAPLRDESSAILSSGTWSLLGVELDAPVLTPAARTANLTNERGIAGTTRLLKNVMGLWLEQECARTWELGHEQLFREAAEAPAGGALIDPDDPIFLAPGDMPARIANGCRALGQTAPSSRGEIVRCILESLACKYRYVLEQLESASGRSLSRIHVIGGGAQVAFLCQLTADLCQREVLAGPVEATALGNILVQALGAGELASLHEVRAAAARSAVPVLYEPATGADDAGATYARFLDTTHLHHATTA